MIVTALVAASQWDSLAIDPRDAAILEPLPVRRRHHPARQAFGDRHSRRRGGVRRQRFSQPRVSVAARVQFPPDERVRAMLGARGDARRGHHRGSGVRLSGDRCPAGDAGGRARPPRVHRGVAVGAGCADRHAWQRPVADARRVRPACAARRSMAWRALSPPMWFLGAYESVVGGVIADLPRTEMRPRQAATDVAMSELYQQRRPEFPALARRAVVAIGAAFSSPRLLTSGTRGASPRSRPRRRRPRVAAGTWVDDWRMRFL